MRFLNMVLLEGNLTKDPESFATKDSSSIVSFTIANNREVKGSVNKVVFMPIKTFGNLATNCSKYLKKGDSVRVCGYLNQEEWQDKDGKKKTKITITATQIEFLSSKNSGSKNSKENETLEDRILDEDVILSEFDGCEVEVIDSAK